jgi:hypothetical protein
MMHYLVFILDNLKEIITLDNEIVYYTFYDFGGLQMTKVD